MSHFCHAELVEACRDIRHVQSPFDGLRVTVVSFYETINYFLDSRTRDLQVMRGNDKKIVQSFRRASPVRMTRRKMSIQDIRGSDG